MALSAHYHFEPRPVAVARGNEKGRVERAIRYIRDGFFAARQWADIDDLNAQADAWCAGTAVHRPCPEDPRMTVSEAFAQEQPHLLALPDNPFETDERVEVSVGKSPEKALGDAKATVRNAAIHGKSRISHAPLGGR